MLTDWQKDMLNQKNLYAKVESWFGEKIPHLHIYATSNERKMNVEEVMRIIQSSDLKPLIHRPDNPFTARFATKKEVLNFLKKRI